MANKVKQILKLMVKDPENITSDFVWATRKEIKQFKKQGYRQLNPEKN
jgi:hypothetical protein